uniref:Uncharacterized protein n=1 Tax=Noctiluca scintillans TaxID=2966 RepID=A0A7S1A0C2_NOCSC|mmetsp:Transcript_26002/g.68233  ORF Transcript_26002/g.68233 Transcript_26002/m.68233 type:complete len:948 (+) Transcript_26002:88-2931(+)|eukprot:CAMPEP_0194535446 /NCGR_PEP_ID=MMETSP0253-20130528/73963_1 /TAXON_ID=2966 /ORGANISM="Noctiluca scintillans" /LENGTH=947 /DNA_ID=CAMNT_0039381219 /DNA_START=80 /DNA_END=2923 /DNA_ORIENTATION=+
MIAGALLTGKEVFQYNRKNFFFDKKLRQVRDFQEQDMRVEQFKLYREDVRDLVELTVSKMDLYMVLAALLADKTFMMICKSHEALPPNAPEWAVALNALSLGSAVFYLLLSLWLAMYASVSATSFGTRLLTQFVRLPVASEQQIGASTAKGADFEGAGLAQMGRIPLISSSSHTMTPGGLVSTVAKNVARRTVTRLSQSPPPGPTSQDSARSFDTVDTVLTDATGSDAAPQTIDDPQNLVPSAMLDHIRLYRRVQLNWQAYDAYARVSLFVGANSLLYSCLYWSLGQFLNSNQQDAAIVPAMGVAAIFSTIQLVLARLDLRLQRKEVVGLGILLAMMPLFTTIGLLVHKKQHRGASDSASSWLEAVQNGCALMSHGLHSVVLVILMIAARPDFCDSDEDALLPGKFRSTLFLDVFGWLVNPSGPGARSSAVAPEPTDNTSDTHSEAGASSAYTALSAASTAWNWFSRGAGDTPPSHLELEESDAKEARRLLLPPNEKEKESNRDGALPYIGAVGSAAGGASGAASGSASGSADVGHADAPTINRLRHTSTRLSNNAKSVTFGSEDEADEESYNAGPEALPLQQMEDVNRPDVDTATTMGGVAPPRQVKHVQKYLPGQTPWRVFCWGTCTILIIWVSSTIWALTKMLPGVSGWEPHNPTLLDEIETHFRHNLLQNRTVEAACGSLPLPRDSTMWLTTLSRQGSADPVAVRHERMVAEGGCSLRRPTLDVAMACDEENRRCVAALLRPGGREVSLCRVVRRGGPDGHVRLMSATSVRVMVGAPSLQQLGLAVAVDGKRGLLDSLRFYGRGADGSLLMFRADQFEGGYGRLIPEAEIEGPTSISATSQGSVSRAALEEGERLFATSSVLVMLTARDGGRRRASEDAAIVCEAAHGQVVLGSCRVGGALLGAGLELKSVDLLSGTRAAWKLPMNASGREEALISGLCGKSV